MSYPTSIDSYSIKNTGDTIQASHINDLQTGVVAIETKVGITGSADTSTIDYKLTNTSSSDPGHKHTLSSLSDFNVSSPAIGDIMKYNGTKWINQAGLFKFGGTGADGALSISSGTTTIDCASAALVIKNYTSISITGTANVVFTNPATNGTTVIFKSQGFVTLTSGANPTIDLRNMGAPGGAGGGTGSSGKAGGGGGGGASIYTDGNSGSQGGTPETSAFGTIGSSGNGVFSTAGGSPGNASGAGPGGLSLTSRFGMNSAFSFKVHNCFLATGSGGGGGAGGQTSSGTAGGKGAGAFYIECGGAYTAATSVINASGTAGTNNASANGGAGGGGGAGMIVVLYASLVSDTGTYTVTGGTGGTATSTNTGGAGAAGTTLIAKNTEFA